MKQSSSSEVKITDLTRAWNVGLWVTHSEIGFKQNFILTWYFFKCWCPIISSAYWVARLQFQFLPVEAAVFINDRQMFSVDYYLWSKLNLAEWAGLVLSSHIPTYCKVVSWFIPHKNKTIVVVWSNFVACIYSIPWNTVLKNYSIE